MLKQFRRAFSSTQGRFNIFSTLNFAKNLVSTPLKHLKRAVQPSGVNYSPQLNTTSDAFEEVSQEWQAMMISNPYDLNTFNYLEATSQTNFGTVDNPHVVFTSDAPFKYIGCTGQPNEDDYEGHEFLLIMLREGPLQRCPGCGQVFKLVRLRDEYSPEMDYYNSGILPYETQEMSEFDTPTLMNPLKLATHYEYSQFETASNTVYSLVNPDDHDRILTDPAYRMEKTLKSEQLFKIYVDSLRAIDEEYTRQHGDQTVYPMNRVDYVTLIDVEKAVLKIDRTLKKVAKFQARKLIDPANHARREKRMLERKNSRWTNSYTFYYGGLTEEEQQYRDYYESDLEKYPENEKLEEKLDEQSILSRNDYRLENFDFQELYTNNPEDDQTTLAERKVFKYKYRQVNDSAEVFAARNERMIQAHLTRFSNPEFIKQWDEARKAVRDNVNDNEAAMKYFSLLKAEAVQQYKDYYQDDIDHDFSFLQGVEGIGKLTSLVFLKITPSIKEMFQDLLHYLDVGGTNPLDYGKISFLDLNELFNELTPQIKQIQDEAEDLAEKNISAQVLEWRKEEKLEETKKLGEK